MTATIRYPINLADPGDAETLAALINAAYRGESSRQGWTTEADLLDGLRSDAEEIAGLLNDPRRRLLCCRDGARLLGCVLLQPDGSDAVGLSMLAVLPTLQGAGIGKRLLLEAEVLARDVWRAERTNMWVIGCRDELIAFYRRRGYHPTGESRVFPHDPRWSVKVDGLILQRLEKRL